MRLPTIGELRHRLRLEAATRAADGGGGATVTWSLIAEVWASKAGIGGGEQVSAEGLDGRITHEIWIRYRSDAVPSMRFTEGSAIFDIHAAVDPDATRRWLRCLVEQSVC